MKISLCMPVALRAKDTRRAEMLVDCLQSVLRQNHTDFEVIVKDALVSEPITRHKNVQDMMDAFGSRLKYFVYPDRGITHGLNQAYSHSTGDLMYCLCSDDQLGPNDALAFVNEQFSVHDPTEPRWIYGSVGCLNEDDTEGPWGITPFATLDELLIHNRMGTMSIFWNRAMFDRIGYWEYERAGDYDYWCRCYRTAVPMYTTRVLGVGRRWHESASWIDRDIVEKEAAAIAKKHAEAHARGEAPVYVKLQ